MMMINVRSITTSDDESITARKLAKLAVVPFLLSCLCSPAHLHKVKTGGRSQRGSRPAAMRAELDRSKSKLKLEDVAAPYYIEYRVIDLDRVFRRGRVRSPAQRCALPLPFSACGGAYRRLQARIAISGRARARSTSCPSMMTRSRCAINSGWPPTALTRQAAQSLTAKQAQLKQLTIDQPVDDFARATPVQSVGPLVKLEFDPHPWTERCSWMRPRFTKPTRRLKTSSLR